MPRRAGGVGGSSSVKRRPGTRTVAIADFTNIDVDVVERELAALSADGKVVGEPIIGPNNCPTKSWREVIHLIPQINKI